MNLSNPKVLVGGMIAIALALFGWYYYNENKNPGRYDGFAQCIKDSGALFYGAFWCPHCQNQKEMFGKSEKLLPYVECSTPNGQGQLQICTDAGVSGYPTWAFSDGSRLSGEVPLATLSEKTGCALPQ